MSKKRIWLIIEILAALVLLILLGFFIKRKLDDQAYLEEQNTWKQSLDQAVVAKGENWKEERDQSAIEQVEKIRKNYPNVVGIIEIPGTKVLYPILQGQDNEFYLNHDRNGNYHAFGEIFLDSRSQMEFKDQNSIIYGHNIRQAKTLFNELLKYKDQDFYEQHKNINVYTLDGFKSYEVIQAFVAKPEEAYREIAFSDKMQYMNFLNKYNSMSLVTTEYKNILDKENKKIITLSTCFDKKTRMVLQAMERTVE